MKHDPDNPNKPVSAASAETEVLLTPREAAQHLRMSKSSLDKLRCRRDGPPFYAPTKRKIVYRRSDLDAWLGERRYQSTRDYDDGEED